MIDTAISTADPRRLAYIGKAPGSKPTRDSDDWHTPPAIVEAARRVLGRIDLDPFSSDTANRTIKATRYLSKADNALHPRQWTDQPCTCWINPPYGRGIVDQAIDRFLAELPRLTAALVLTNNSTETRWFCRLAARSTAILFTDHRVSFISPDSKAVSGNTRGQAIFYFGPHRERFAAEFQRFGWIATVDPPGPATADLESPFSLAAPALGQRTRSRSPRPSRTPKRGTKRQQVTP
jgi:phage N-6-adenine-methyltransferase